ncbi:MAG: GAP family protein [Candidatus Yanofskybacteria bacterium]|nr:GAP family protein [Candidatus Yanofskybacteria bacterium]
MQNHDEKICSDPAVSRGPKLKTWIILGVVLAMIFVILRFSGFGTGIIWDISKGGKWLLPLVVSSALIDSINPCAFSILLLTIGILFSIGRLRSNILRVGGMYILGIFIVYLLIGLGTLHVLHLFDTPHFMAKIGAILLVAFGVLNIFEVVWPGFPIKLRIPQGTHHKMAGMIDRASTPTAFALGALVGICEFPCTGGPYLAVLGLLHDSTKFWSGISYLVFYNLIFVLPLIIILFIASNKEILSRVQSWQKQERKNERLIAGFLMVALGAVIFLL